VSAETALWFGRIPDRWSWGPLGRYFTERRETVSDQLFTPLSVTKDGIVPQLDTAAKTNDGDNRKRVAKGDFVINSRSDRKGSSGLSTLDGSVSVISTVITPRASLRPDFVHHLLRSAQFQEEYYRYGTGIVADLWSTRYSQMKKIPIPVPPVEEQRRIAEFLDRETAQIDQLIAKQEQLIATLGERVLARLAAAFTAKGGLSDSVTHPVLGPTPVGWKVVRMKYLLHGRRSGTSVNATDEPAMPGELGVLKTSSVSSGKLDLSQNKKVDDPEEVARLRVEIRPGTVLVNRANSPQLVGAAALVVDAPSGIFLSDKLWELDVKADPRFLTYWMRTTAYRSQVGFCTVGASSSMQNLAFEDFKEFFVPMPTAGDQLRIATELEEFERAIEVLVAAAHSQVELLRERRQALISAAVTGQIDVEGAS